MRVAMKHKRGLGLIAFIFLVLFLVAFLALAIYLVRLDSIVRERFEGQRWEIPAKVFARPLEIFKHAELQQSDLIQELKLLGYKSANDYTKPGTYFVKANSVYVHTRGFDFGDAVEPEQVLALQFDSQNIADVRTTKPSSTGIVRLEPMLIGGIYPQHKEDRVLIQLKNVPQTVIDALIATEDRQFFEHHGVSFRGIARAMLRNATGGRQGGSTLTQQLVKNFYLTPERTIKRKANEALMALLVEFHYSKEEILEAYLNEVNLGQNGNYSINGYGLAAQFYFGQPLRELNIAQQAYLAGLVQGPSLYNPWRNPELALKRRNIVLNNMLVMGKLSQDQYDREVARPLGVIDKPNLGPAKFPDFMDIVRRQLRNEYQESDLTNKGLRIFTTLDPLVQVHTEQAFKSSVKRLIQAQPKRLADLQGAAVVARPENGEILAAVGSTQDFTGFNRVLDANRQVGSLLKPVIYLNALESGRYHWATPIDDSAISIRTPDGKTWTPKNYAGNENGLVPMSRALAQSYNLSAVRLGQEFGVGKFQSQLRQLGVNTNLPNYPSTFLGAVSMSPMDVLGLYQNFATGGFNYPRRSIRAVVDANGRLLERYSLNVNSSISPANAYLINFGLQEVMRSGTGRAAYAQLSPDLALAGKSGTTNDNRDAWFAGYSGNHIAVVWLGLDDNKVMGLTGSSGALPVWTSIMRQLPNKPVNLVQPDSIQWQWIDGIQGDSLSAESCTGALHIPLLVNTIPRQVDPCAAHYYEAETPVTANELSPSEFSNADEIQNYIRQSEEDMEDQLSERRMISSGQYSGY